MVKKLIKQEFIYYLRTLIFILPIVLGAGISVRFVQLFESDNPWYYTIFICAILVLGFSTAICVAAPTVLGIIRFYKNMYSAEGYLTFTLPVNNHQHLISKTLVMVICEIVAVIVALIAWMIAASGVPEVWDAIGTAINGVIESVPSGHLTVLIIEFIVLILIALLTSPLLFYSCISIGQLSKKYKILVAIAVYYGYSIVGQVISTIISMIFSFSAALGDIDALIEKIASNPFGYMHGAMWIIIVLYAGLGALFYFINIRIMTRKLNLE
jgi:hypothetical protein